MGDDTTAQRQLLKRRLLIGDLHNHSMLSDGEGDPLTAFAQLRAAGLDFAALTDHASIPRHLVGGLRVEDYPSATGFPLVRTAPRSLDSAEWVAAGRFADLHDDPGQFTAIRGFEWTEPWLGHINVWGSSDFLPVTTPGTVTGLHDWLVAQQPEALFGYNHPGREEGRFEGFRHDERLVERMVALEMFNRYDDYIAVGVRHGEPSPLLACLRAGWRPGLIGVSDEHGRDYGLRGKGRTGVWVERHDRAGVAAGLARREVFATREPGLRLSATLDGAPFGARVTPASHRLTVDLDATERWADHVLVAQVLGDDGGLLPVVLTEEVLDPRGLTSVELDPPSRCPWLVLRIAVEGTHDRSIGLDETHPLTSRALAYGSPWWLRSDETGAD